MKPPSTSNKSKLSRVSPSIDRPHQVHRRRKRRQRTCSMLHPREVWNQTRFPTCEFKAPKYQGWPKSILYRRSSWMAKKSRKVVSFQSTEQELREMVKSVASERETMNHYQTGKKSYDGDPSTDILRSEMIQSEGTCWQTKVAYIRDIWTQINRRNYSRMD